MLSKEQKTIQFPTGKEIVKPCQSAQALANGHSRNESYGMAIPKACHVVRAGWVQVARGCA
jgi:hypothetical protein